MATCSRLLQDKINNNDIASITQLPFNTRTPLAISPASKQLYSLIVPNSDTALFTIELYSSNREGNVGVTITIYSYDSVNKTITLIGSTYITEMFLTFQKDFNSGSFFICISSSYYTYNGFLTGVFSGYISQPRFSVANYTGQNFNLNITQIPITPPTCRQPLFFQKVDGVLPPGMTLNLNGIVEGVIPNMDCIEDNKDLSPSTDWYYNNDVEWGAWTRRWLFKARVWIPHRNPIDLESVSFVSGQELFIDYLITESISNEETYISLSGESLEEVDLYVMSYWGPEAFQWFCISVYNNWSWDKDHYDKMPLDTVIESIIPCENVVIPREEIICCEEPKEEKKTFIPQPIVYPCPCETITAEEELINSFIKWYRENANTVHSDYIKEFVESFKDTSLYNKLMIDSGLADEILTPREKQERQEEKNRQDILAAQINGRNITDVDYIMLVQKDEENKKLPLTVYGTTGTTMEADI